MSAYLFQIAREKSCDYVLIIFVKKYEIAYHNYAEAKRAHQVQNKLLKSASDMVCLVKTTTYAQNNIIKGYFHIFKAQNSKSG